jgi:uncharacterized protein with HEPN domain
MQHDLIRLRHMLAAAKEAIEFAVGKTREDLEKDRVLALATIKSIEIIGEAASKVTEEFKSENRNIPWDDIINMRHRLIHAYFDVNLDIVWQTIETDLPELIKGLEEKIPPEET